MLNEFRSSSSSSTEQNSVSGNSSISSSTQHHRHVQRANGMSEVVGAALSTLSVAAVIPTKLAQTLLSGHAFFSPKIRPIERVAHGIQASLAIGQLLCVIMLFYKGNECHCESEKDILCRSIIVLDLLYQGTLLVGWLPSEAFKQVNNRGSSHPTSIDQVNDMSSIITTDGCEGNIIDLAAEEEEPTSLSMV